jgi:arginyl-tRNA synthetase
MKEQLQQLIESALQALIKAGELPSVKLPPIKLERSKDPAHGDFATNIALALAKPCGMPPRQLAEKISTALPHDTIVSHCEIAGPGFINLFLAQASQMAVVTRVLETGAQFGHGTAGHKNSQPRKLQVEFVSANPTGPLHVGHGRGAAIGDSLCRLLEASGWDVTREFYYNDAGQQINNLTLSVKLRCQGFTPDDEQWPQDGYRGDYINDVANAFIKQHGKSEADNDEKVRQFAVDYLRAEQDRDLQAFDVRFDVFSLESALYSEGKVEQVVEQLTANGYCYEKDNALWLRSTEFGDDKDRVMRKSDGSYTYFVPDVAYHREKWQRGFNKVVNEQGADHHSTITRVRAGLQALDIDIPQGWPDYVLHQMVTVLKNGEEVKISKRAGSYVTLRDLIDQVGKDATRYFLVARRADSQLTFDIDLALQKNNENPVYYIQYAHARVCSALRLAEEKHGGFNTDIGLSHLELLNSDTEIALVKLLESYPEKVANAARELAPHSIAAYLRDLAAALHGWYATGNQDASAQWLVENDQLRNARLCLAQATRQVLANGMSLLGISSPEQM